ncbi:MAG: hypothetical protein LBL23_05815 [Coriobacteriales bacterium]|jgi:hypothetical protein|nr:hypothetical protein [Coriobacteriales bacterium]
MKKNVVAELKAIPLLLGSVALAFLFCEFLPPFYVKFAPGEEYDLLLGNLGGWIFFFVLMGVILLEILVVSLVLYLLAKLVKRGVGYSAWLCPLIVAIPVAVALWLAVSGYDWSPTTTDTGGHVVLAIVVFSGLAPGLAAAGVVLSAVREPTPRSKSPAD